MTHGDMNHGDMNHGVMNHGVMNHGDLNHGDLNHGDMNHDDLNHGDMNHADLHHDHTPVDASDWPQKPSISLIVNKDSMSGWNLQIVVNHFAFSPERVNTASVAGEGHAHLYIDGKKHARLYSPWFHLNDLEPGTHTITATLNANDHGHLVVDGNAVAATVVVEQQ